MFVADKDSFEDFESGDAYNQSDLELGTSALRIGRYFLITMMLLAINGSTRSDAAVRRVGKHPWPAGSIVRVLAVIEA
jgi:hypothetical protein